MKKHLILLGVLLFSQLSMAEDLAPTKARIIAQDSAIAWVKFRDNSDGDFFRFYFDGKTNSAVISDKKDTKKRNGKSRVVPFKLNTLPPKTYKVTIGVIKDNQKVAESSPFDLTIGESNQAPTISKVFKGSERYRWVKFIDHSDGDLFRFYFNGEVNNEAIKDYKDTKARNGKSRVVPINVTKLAPNSKFDVTIGVIKDGKKIAESKAFTIETGDAVDLEAKVIEYNREHGVSGDKFQGNVKVDFYFDNHLAVIYGSFHGPRYINIYRIDDNNNIRYLDDFDNILYDPQYHEYNPIDHEYYGFYPYDNDTKLKITLDRPEGIPEEHLYDVSDLDNIIKID